MTAATPAAVRSHVYFAARALAALASFVRRASSVKATLSTCAISSGAAEPLK